MKQNLEIVTLKIDEIKPFEHNPRINVQAVAGVKESIQENGYNQYLLVNQDNVICIGHTRYEALKELGYKEVPVFKKKMTKKAFIRYNVADNKVAEKSEWDFGALTELLEAYDQEGGDYKGTGFTEEEYESLMGTSDIDDLIGEVATPSASSGNKAHIKQVQIFLDDVTFPKFIEMCEAIQNYMTTDNLTDTVYNAVEKVYDEIRNKQ